MDLTGSEQPVHIMENLLTQSLLIEMLTTSKNIFATVYADGLQFVMVRFFLLQDGVRWLPSAEGKHFDDFLC